MPELRTLDNDVLRLARFKPCSLTRAMACYDLGHKLLIQNNWHEARMQLEEALKLYERNEQMTKKLVSTYRALAYVSSEQADFDQSSKYMKKVIAILEAKQPMSDDLGKAYFDLAMLASYQEDHAEATSCFEKAAEIYESQGRPRDIEAMASIYYNIGHSLALSGLGKAQRWFDKARNLPQVESFCPGVMANIFSRLANCSHDQDEEARQDYYEKTLMVVVNRLMAHDGSSSALAPVYTNIGLYVQQQQGNRKLAQSYFQRSFQLHEIFNPGSTELAEDCFNIGFVLYEQGEHSHAQQWFQKVLQLIGALRHTEKRPLYKACLTFLEANTQSCMGRILHDKGDYEQSLRHYQAALDMLNDLGSRRIEAFRGLDPRPLPTRVTIEQRIRWNPFRLLSLSHDLAPAVWCHVISSKFQNDPHAMYYLLREHPQSMRI